MGGNNGSMRKTLRGKERCKPQFHEETHVGNKKNGGGGQGTIILGAKSPDIKRQFNTRGFGADYFMGGKGGGRAASISGGVKAGVKTVCQVEKRRPGGGQKEVEKRKSLGGR